MTGWRAFFARNLPVIGAALPILILLVAAGRRFEPVPLRREQIRPCYNAAHALALAALRYHGFRSDSRYVVYQTVPHTLGLPAAEWGRLVSSTSSQLFPDSTSTRLVRS
jgi:hypothetical protein